MKYFFTFAAPQSDKSLFLIGMTKEAAKLFCCNSVNAASLIFLDHHSSCSISFFHLLPSSLLSLSSLSLSPLSLLLPHSLAYSV